MTKLPGSNDLDANRMSRPPWRVKGGRRALWNLTEGTTVALFGAVMPGELP